MRKAKVPQSCSRQFVHITFASGTLQTLALGTKDTVHHTTSYNGGKRKIHSLILVTTSFAPVKTRELGPGF